MDTIYALASAAGKAGVSVVRISGFDALKIAKCLGANLSDHDRKLVKIMDRDGLLIDEAFALSFAPGRSFTGEQVVELQTHGSPAIVSSVLDELAFFGGRIAEAGEFTRRAMENGRMDLARVEGLADLIEAETEGQRQQAIRIFQGELGDLVEKWRVKLVRAAALLEATIDFVEEDVPVDVLPEVTSLIETVSMDVTKEANGVGVRERLRDGFEIALIGPPNSGKSTLLNKLAGRDAAITSDIAGTTRDVIEIKMDLNGVPVTFLDTAGVRDSKDTLEAMGIQKGMDRAKSADIRIHLSADGESEIQKFETGMDLIVRSKADIVEELFENSISAKTGVGIDWLVSSVEEYLRSLISNAGIATRRRHELSLRLGSDALNRVLMGLSDGDLPIDLLAEEVRIAIRSLDSLIGRVDVENVLDEIFSSFCIGK